MGDLVTKSQEERLKKLDSSFNREYGVPATYQLLNCTLGIEQ